MKQIILLYFTIISICSFGQFDFNFPDNVEFDPLNSDLRALDVKKIEQSYFSDNDSTSDILEYIFQYDTLSNLSSFKLSFFSEKFGIPSKQEIGGPILKNKIHGFGKHGNSRVYYFNKVPYAYAEYKFSWQSFYIKEVQYSLPNLSSKAPIEHILILNNPFNKIANPDSIISTKLYTDNRIYKEETKINNTIIKLKEYEYQKITRDDKDYFLLTRIIIIEDNNKIIKRINYIF